MGFLGFWTSRHHGSHLRTENRVGGPRIVLAWDPGERESSSWSHRDCPRLTAVGLVAVVVGNAERPSWNTRLQLCRQRPLPWEAMVDLDEKKQLMVSNSL